VLKTSTRYKYNEGKRNVGQNERQRENARDSKRERAKQTRSRRSEKSGNIDVRSCDWVAVCALITAFGDAGGAVRVGLTRDGGAWAFGCYLGDDYATEYVRPSEDFRGALIEIAEAWLPEEGISYHQALNEFEQKAHNR